MIFSPCYFWSVCVCVSQFSIGGSFEGNKLKAKRDLHPLGEDWEKRDIFAHILYLFVFWTWTLWSRGYNCSYARGGLKGVLVFVCALCVDHGQQCQEHLWAWQSTAQLGRGGKRGWGCDDLQDDAVRLAEEKLPEMLCVRCFRVLVASSPSLWH